MPGRQPNRHPAASERHHGLAAPARGEKFRLPRERVADLGEALLVHRSGHHAGETSAGGAAGGELHRFEGDQLAGLIGLTGMRDPIGGPDGEAAAESRDPIGGSDRHNGVGQRRVRL